MIVIAAGVALGGWLALRDGERPEAGAGSGGDSRDSTGGDEWRAVPGFVGSAACRSCHPEQFASYLETAHSQALAEVRTESEPSDAVFDDSSSRYRYRTTKSNGRLVHEVSLLSASGSESGSRSFPLAYRVGSGRVSRTYIIATDGFFVESPITWWEQWQRWGLSPGYNASRHPFGRLVVEDCLFCHAGNVETSAASDYSMRFVELSIGCERCHGPGKAHVEEKRSGGPAGKSARTIVNPRHLPRDLTQAICQQCHMQGDFHVSGRGESANNFHPGELLEKYRQEFRVREPKAAMQIVEHSEQLARSACYRQSETLTCVTCHDPHASVPQEDRAEHYRSICLACHQNESCKTPLSERMEQSQNECVRCHMPANETELPHVAFTHHQIGIHPLKSDEEPESGDDLLVPLFDLASFSESDRQRTLGLAWLELSLRTQNSRDAAIDRVAAGIKGERMLTSLPQEFVDEAVAATLARHHFARRDRVEAEEAGRRLLRMNGISTESRISALLPLATASFYDNRFEEATEHFTELTQLRRSARDWYFLGLCRQFGGNAGEATGAFEKSWEIDPSAIETCQALAALSHAANELDAERRWSGEVEWLRLWSANRANVEESVDEKLDEDRGTAGEQE
ncbi:MAG TPA: tetratricopeptide repeat protein [Planctomycetaceae bacterium]|nr:tetratricopeptide repeat protein [Planctomycetaceae bacterium]